MTDPSVATTSEHGILPLAPVERPTSLISRLLYWGTRLRYGKTPTAFRVVYARLPAAGVVSLCIVTVLDRWLTIGHELRYLVQVAAAMRQGCTFCADLLLAEAARSRVGTARFTHLLDFEDSAHFTPRERAALAYVEAVTASLTVPDAVFARLREHFSEREIVEIVWVCAVERYFNGMALPLRVGSDHLAGGKRTA